MKAMIKFKLILALLLILNGCWVYQGQLDGGPSFSKQSFGNSSSSSQNKTVTGYSLGASGNTRINEEVDVEIGLNFSKRGNKNQYRPPQEGEFEYNEVTQETFMSYIDLPVLIRYEPLNKFHLYGGLQPSFLLGAKSKFDGTQQKINVMDNFKTLDLSGNLGVGYDLSNKYGVRMFYRHGLTNINAIETSGLGSIKNRSLDLKVYYRF